ncbi:hypothetical protein D3C72_1278390 [compost metagenome]
MGFVPQPCLPDFTRPAIRGLPQAHQHLREGRPVIAGLRRGRNFSKGKQRLGVCRDGIENIAGLLWSDAGQHLQQPETGDAVARVLREAQHGQHVLHMGAVEEFQAAKFDEGDVAAGQFHLERPAVAGGAKQHGLLFQRHAGFAVCKNLVDDEIRLFGFVLHRHELRALQ